MPKLIDSTHLEHPETGERIFLVAGQDVPDWAMSPDPKTPGLVGSHLFEPEVDKRQPPAEDAPKGNASRDEWAAWATKQGAPDEETRPTDEGGLKQAELRDKYGK